MPTPLRPDQIEDLAFYIANPKCANLSDPGCGKTPSVCVYIEYLWSYKGTKTIWSMPKSLLRKNKMELLRFTNLTEDQIVLVDGTPMERMQQMSRSTGVVFLMGFKRFADDWKTLKNYHPQINAKMIDEVHMGFKGYDSQRTKELFKFMRETEYFLPMSGTLIDGKLDSCYPTIKIIEPRYYASHNSFMQQHAIVDEYGTVVEWQNHDKLGRIFKRHCIRRTFESVHGKVEVVITHEMCEMHEKQREAYDEFESLAILELEDKFLDGTNPAVAAIRCRQIMGHPHTFGLLKSGETTGKDDALETHFEDHMRKKEPLLIYASLNPEQERIASFAEKSGLRTGLINGTVHTKERDRIDIAFQKGELDCVVGSAATAAVGYNWGHVDHIIYASLDYQDSSFKQARSRAIRGARKPLWVTVLEYRNSIDQRIFTIVNKKSGDMNKVDSSYEKLDLGTKDIED